MESTRPIRALIRGLDALTVLNCRNAATVSEIAQEIRLPRTTVYRILETLSVAGFVLRDASDDRYRLTVGVRSLSSGFDDDAWVGEIARPFMGELGREVVWPVSLATPLGSCMIIRAATDPSSPLATERHCAGHRQPLLATAAGRVYLSFCPAAQRDALIDVLARSNREEDRMARTPRPELKRMLGEIRSQGHCAMSRTHRPHREIALSVPVIREDRVLASLTVRFGATAITEHAAIERFLPKLKECASRIGDSFAQRQAEAPKGAPQRAA